MIFWDKLRGELGRYADGVHELGAPADAKKLKSLPPVLAELYRSFDGLRLFTDTFVIVGCGNLSQAGERLILGEALGAPLEIDTNGRVYELDEVGDPILVGSDVGRYLEAVMAREKLVVDRDGEWKDVFAEGGELDDQTREKRVRVAIKIDPESAAWRLESAEILFEEGREEEAGAELLCAVNSDAQAGVAWALLGGLYLHGGRRAEAAEAFRRAAESSRDSARRGLRFAEAARASASNGELRAKWAAAAHQSDRGVAARLVKESAARMEEGDSDSALHLAELAEAVEPGAAGALLGRARVKSKLKVL